MIDEITDLKKAVTSPDSIIKAQVNKQQEIIIKQQRNLEALDRKESECNLVLLGVPERRESLDGATTDETKIEKVWTASGSSTAARRLGREGNRCRPILITVASRNDRDAVLERAKRLKEAGDNYKKVSIKKDKHPAVREEWKRLREAE